MDRLSVFRQAVTAGRQGGQHTHRPDPVAPLAPSAWPLMRIHVTLPCGLTNRLQRLAKDHGTTVFGIVVSGWAALLSRWSGQEEVVIGTTVFNLDQGIYAPTVIRLQLGDDVPVGELLKRVALGLVQAPDNLRRIGENEPAAVDSAMDCSPIYRVEMTDGREPRELCSRQELAEPNESRCSNKRVHLSLLLTEREECLEAELEYACELFPKDMVERMATAWEVILERMTVDASQSISRLPILTSRQRELVLYGFNQTTVPYPKDSLIHELFERQVRRSPEAVAVSHDGQSISYAELNRRANQLGRYLRGRGAGANQLVAVCLERSVEMIVALLAVLKSGSAYVPLDPEYPAERLAHMLKSSAPRILLTKRAQRELLPQIEGQIVEIDQIQGAVATFDDSDLPRTQSDLDSSQLAYVIYTSGSTGLPKGAMNEHRGMVNRIAAQRSIENFSDTDVCCQTTSISFVDAVFEIFGTLCNGLRLVIIPAAVVRDLSKLAALIRHSQVTRLVTVPLLARSMLENPTVVRDVSALRSWTLSGEAVSADLVKDLQRQLPTCEVIIQYGSSEVSSDAAIYKSRRFTGNRVPLGRPLQNVHIYILDKHGEPVPIDVAGEIHVGGVGVGRGYLNRPELTVERFSRDRFDECKNGRLYRTGDLGRWRSDGSIEYIGRADHQIKIRGFRVEPGEIEAQLLRNGLVRQVVVMAREDVPGDKRLVAYITPHEVASINFASSPPEGGVSSAQMPVGESTSLEESRVRMQSLRTHLKGVLPDYMMPSAFVLLERFPLTPNGKLDRRALPAPRLDAYLTRPYEAPQGETEEALAAIWRELLGLPRVGRRDNFFELGGHSLSIVQMIERLRRIGLSAETIRVLDSPTLADLAGALTAGATDDFEIPPILIPSAATAITPDMLPLVTLKFEHIDRIVAAVPGGAANIQDIYCLGPLQEGILFHHRMKEDGEDAYVVPILLSISSKEKLEKLIEALQRAIDRHDVLRTAVFWEGLPQPVQVVHRVVTLPAEEVLLDKDRDALEQLKEWSKPERRRVDLRRAPIMRLRFAQDPRGTPWYALLTIHHIVQDAASLRAVIAEVVAHFKGIEDRLPTSALYRDYIAEVMAYGRTGEAESYFSRTLGGVDAPTAPFGVLDVYGSREGVEEYVEEFGPALSRRLREQARTLNVSAATVVHAAWSLVLSHTTNRNDVVFGSVLSGRMQGKTGAQRIVGMFINMLPIRIALGNLTAMELIGKTQKHLVELLNHEQASLSTAHRCSGMTGAEPLFTTVLNYRRSLLSFEEVWAGAAGVELLSYFEQTNYPITISVDDLERGFILTAQTDRRISAKSIVGYLRTAICSLLEALDDDSRSFASELSVVPDSERIRAMVEFNATEMLFPDQKPVHLLFEEQAQRTPGATAVDHSGKSLTYAQLNNRANQLARYLRNEGVVPDDIVGICVDRSIEMVIGLLGILKAGGAYLPLDPSYPSDRLQYMIQDAAPRIVLVHEELMGLLPTTSATVLALNTKLREIEGYVDSAIPPSEFGVTSQNLVYIIYTSGSTGRPKGTAMPHCAMVNLIEWHRQTLGISEGVRVLQFAALSFDVAFQEIFSTLCTGGTLVLLDEWVRRDPRALMAFLLEKRIDRLFVPPLMLQSLAECSATVGSIPIVSDVVTAGEQLRISPEIVRFFARLPGCRLHNHYGPTETHVVTALTLDGPSQEWPVLPSIGRPIANSQIYVLDNMGQSVPIGVAGEIYIGGAGVARGYLGKADLTAQRFVVRSIGSEPRKRLYRTGDLGRWRPDGTLEYLGRNDQQVKIRGYRVELGEIESHLLTLDDVREAVVIAREDVPGHKRLVAYVTRYRETTGAIEDMRSRLKSILPEHMVPSAFVILRSLPLSPNGKLDRGALPAPNVGTYVTQAFEPLQGSTEQVLASIWCDLLGLHRVGRGDNFFELGGDSLQGMKLVERIAEQMFIKLRVISVFQHPTVEGMAGLVESSRAVDPAMVTADEPELLEGVI